MFGEKTTTDTVAPTASEMEANLSEANSAEEAAAVLFTALQNTGYEAADSLEVINALRARLRKDLQSKMDDLTKLINSL